MAKEKSTAIKVTEQHRIQRKLTKIAERKICNLRPFRGSLFPPDRTYETDANSSWKWILEISKEEKNEKGDGGLYSEEELKEREKPAMRQCRICGEVLPEVQWARHVIKKHSEGPQKFPNV